MIADQPENCQQDFIIPTRIKGRLTCFCSLPAFQTVNKLFEYRFRTNRMLRSFPKIMHDDIHKSKIFT